MKNPKERDDKKVLPDPVKAAESSASSPEKPIRELTAEEQWESFEKDLKENDWGHRPC